MSKWTNEWEKNCNYLEAASIGFSIKAWSNITLALWKYWIDGIKQCLIFVQGKCWLPTLSYYPKLAEIELHDLFEP